MKTLLNIIWFFFAGIWLWLTYALAALIMFILVVTIPFAVASMRIANFVVWPFGRTYVDRPTAGAGSLIGNILWFLFAGIWIAIAHVGTAFTLACTIIGIPMAWANLKMIPLALFPLGKEIVPQSAVRAGVYGRVGDPFAFQPRNQQRQY